MNHPLQFDLLKARRRRDRGIAKVSYKNMEMIEDARSIAIGLIHQNGSTTMDDVRKRMSELGYPPPTHPNAYGAVFKNKRFKLITYTKSKMVQRNSGNTGVWGLA